MRKTLVFFSLVGGILFFLPGVYEFTFRIKYYVFPLITSMTLFFGSPLRVKIRKSHIFFLAFFLLSFFTLPFSYSIGRTVDGLVWIFFTMLFSVVISSREVDESFVVKSILWVALILTIGGIFQKFFSVIGLFPLPKDAYGVPMLNFAIGHRNPFSHFISASIPLTFMFKNWFFQIMSILMVIIVYLSDSRAGIFASSFSIFVSFMLWERYGYRKKGIILFTFLLIMLLTPQFRRAVAKTLNLSYPPNKVRLVIWKDVLDMPVEKGIVGYGFSSFPSAFPFMWKEKTAFEISSRRQNQFVEHAHNEFMTVLAENGIFGLVLFLSGWIYVIFRGIKQWEKKKYYLVSLATIFLIGVVDAPLRNSACFLLFVICMVFLGESTRFHFIVKKKSVILFFFIGILPLISLYGRVSATKGYIDFLNGKDGKEVALKKVKSSMKFAPIFHKGFYYLGNLYFLNGKLLEAEECFKRSINLFRGYYTSSFNLALMYLKGGRLGDFEKYVKYTLKLSPYYLKANEMMYLYKMKRGEKEEAMRYFERMRKVRR